MMNDREAIIAKYPLLEFIRNAGVKVVKSGGSWMAVCPFHGDKNASMSVDPKKNVWHCHACKMGGSVIDFVMAQDALTVKEAMEKLGGPAVGGLRPPPTQHAPATAASSAPSPKPEPMKESAVYSYKDENGKELYQVVRYVPKTFRQRHIGDDGKWVYKMDGVRRVLYRWPEWIDQQEVALCEGEKDVDSLWGVGLPATCNVGGAGKWLDSYTDSLRGKTVYIFPDNDEPGQKHAELVAKSLLGKATAIKRITVPAPHKDITDYLESATDKGDAIKALVNASQPFRLECNVPLKSMEEMEKEYQEFVKFSDSRSINLGKWLPSFGQLTRPLVPGDLAVFMADTGVGKTGILQHIALAGSPLPILFFELELPDSLLFERFVQLDQRIGGAQIFNHYKAGQRIPWSNATLGHIYTCTMSRMNPMELERIINASELKLGERPAVVMVDYVGLMQGQGKSRYERISDVAEQLKIIAKSTKTVMILASQIHRKEGDTTEIFLHDAKDSGSIENSAGLVVGAWREGERGETMKLKILKNTKGTASVPPIECNFDGAIMRITERAKDTISDSDLPS